jgi:uncharacterized protein involved in exopolysaccharide biosynthesis
MTNELNLLDILIVLVKHKFKIILNFIAISAVAILISNLMTKYYIAQVVFMPQGPGGTSVSSLLESSSGGDFFGSPKLAKRQYLTLLESRELREELINKFNLIELYGNTDKPNPMDRTLLDLDKTLYVSLEEEGGLGLTNVLSITICAVDTLPARTADMANYAFELLEKKIREINSSEHQAVIDFLTGQIAVCDEKLAAARERKKQFQLANHAYQIPQQVGMVLQAIGSQKAEILALESQKEYMMSTHAADYEGLQTLNQKIRVLNAKITSLETGDHNDIFPGLASSVDLADTYIDVIKDVETYLQLRLLLTQQIEQANIRKAKSYTGIYLVDKARTPQYKFKPKRIVVVGILTVFYMSAFLIILLFMEHFRYMRAHDPQRLAKYESLFSNLTSLKKR